MEVGGLVRVTLELMEMHILWSGSNGSVGGGVSWGGGFGGGSVFCLRMYWICEAELLCAPAVNIVRGCARELELVL